MKVAPSERRKRLLMGRSADEVAAKILEREHVGLPKIVDSFAKGKYEIKGKKVSFVRNSTDVRK